MRRSFVLRLALAFAGVGISAAAVTAILVNVSFGSRFSGYLEEQRTSREGQVVAALEDSYRRAGGWDAEDLASVAPLVLMDGGTLRVQDARGEEVWRASAEDLGGHMSELHRQMMGTGALGPERRLPVEVEGSVVGYAQVRLPEPGVLPRDVAFRDSVNRLLLAGGGLAALVALALGLLLARRATAPARRLTLAARALAAGDRSERIRSSSSDEFGEMAGAFDTMADTIEEEERLRRAFAADVAHELRTPLAILRSQVEGLQDGVMEPGAETLSSLHEEILRLSRLVADLQTLAAAEGAGFSLERRPLRLDLLVEETVRDFAGLFEAEDVRLEVSGADVRVEADPVRVKQMVSNLLSNALKFTPEGGRVEVEVSSDPRWAAVRVSDDGPGIPEEELPRVFDRFFRGRNTRAAGSGIGLTVVRELAEAQGGRVEAGNAPGGGATFLLRLPALSSGAHELFTGPSHPVGSVGAGRGGER